MWVSRSRGCWLALLDNLQLVSICIYSPGWSTETHFKVSRVHLHVCAVNPIQIPGYPQRWCPRKGLGRNPVVLYPRKGLAPREETDDTAFRSFLAVKNKTWKAVERLFFPYILEANMEQRLKTSLEVLILTFRGWTFMPQPFFFHPLFAWC